MRTTFPFTRVSVFQHTAARRRLGRAEVLRTREHSCFNTQPPEGGWVYRLQLSATACRFQHTAARRRLGTATGSTICAPKFQHTAARRRLGHCHRHFGCLLAVSTHSRPKAAGLTPIPQSLPLGCFNTQPPEGGWVICPYIPQSYQAVSTHSRPKAAGTSAKVDILADAVSTHSRPKVAGNLSGIEITIFTVSTHSRPKAAGTASRRSIIQLNVSTHSRPKAAGSHAPSRLKTILEFQHTAARRRLGTTSTGRRVSFGSFNTQPPEGGWENDGLFHLPRKRFQHTAARRRLGSTNRPLFGAVTCFNTQPPEGGWACKGFLLFLFNRFNTQPPEGGWVNRR